MKTLTILGLGSGNLNLLTLKAYKILTTKEVYLRTKIHPCIDELIKEGYQFQDFDEFYESKSFDEVYQKIVNRLIELLKIQDVYYAVPGNPLFNEKTVEKLIDLSKEENFKVEIIPGISYLDTIADILKIDLGEATKLTDVYEVLDNRFSFDPNFNLLISEVWSNFYLSELKLKLMEFYPDNITVFFIKDAGLSTEVIKQLELYKLDREEPNHLTTIFIPKQKNLNRHFDSLMNITAYLRSPEGCPWDRKQTHESLKRYLIEETYEAIDALDKGDVENLKEELGDLLFEITIHSQIATEEAEFNIYDVIENINTKMLNRHPHVFGNVNVNSAEEVLTNWDKIKQNEKNIETITQTMERIPKGTPTLLISDKIQHIAKKVGFDWNNPIPALDKVNEEAEEVREVLNNKEGDKRLKEELGDLLFAVVNVARLANINADEALREANNKFIHRFSIMEQEILRNNKSFEDFTLDELEELWQKAKEI